jgi:hypothetical protein
VSSFQHDGVALMANSRQMPAWFRGIVSCFGALMVLAAAGPGRTLAGQASDGRLAERLRDLPRGWTLIEGQGWRQVDPTAGMGCDSRYVPFFAVENGARPVVYTSAVRIAPRRPAGRER